jgi:hypothetical protein
VLLDKTTPFEYKDVKIKCDENPTDKYTILPELGRGNAFPLTFSKILKINLCLIKGASERSFCAKIKKMTWNWQ